MDTEIHQEIKEIKEHLARQDEHMSKQDAHMSKQDVTAAERGKDVEYIKDIVRRIEESFHQMTNENKAEHKMFGDGIREEKEWRIKFGATVAAYSGLGTAIGGAVMSLIIWYITNKL